MNTIREKPTGSRPAWHYLLALVVIMLWLAACGSGGSGQTTAAPVTPQPPPLGSPQNCAVNPGITHDCPTGAICVGHITGTSVTNISAIAFGNKPDWSADALQIAFQRDGKVYVINADGSGEYELAAGFEPAWSPASNLIAFTSAQGIDVVNRDGSGYKKLLVNDDTNHVYFSSPAWSPDGQQLSYTRLEIDNSRGSTIHTMNANGSGHFRLTAEVTGVEQDPAWSPDGGSVAFVDLDLAVVDVIGNVSRFPVGEVADPDWSPDGGVIAYSAFGRCRHADFEIHVIDLRNRKSTVVLTQALEPAWSPDGTQLAFATDPELPGNEAFPAVSQPAEIYLRQTPSAFGHDSRFVLYDGNRFELQYLVARTGFHAYTGNYSRTGANLSFRFHASSSAGQWTARGYLEVDRLNVSFNVIMQLSDFENGTYVLLPTEE